MFSKNSNFRNSTTALLASSGVERITEIEETKNLMPCEIWFEKSKIVHTYKMGGNSMQFCYEIDQQLLPTRPLEFEDLLNFILNHCCWYLQRICLAAITWNHSNNKDESL